MCTSSVYLHVSGIDADADLHCIADAHRGIKQNFTAATKPSEVHLQLARPLGGGVFYSSRGSIEMFEDFSKPSRAKRF